MSNDNARSPAQDAQAPGRKQLPFQLGQVVATPAVLSCLAAHAIFPAALLSRHQHGDWGDLCPEDARANEQALQSGARIFSSFTVEGTKIWVITEAVGDDGNRASTCLLFPEEY